MGKSTQKENSIPASGVMNKLLLNISILAVLIFIPFTFLNFIQGRSGLGVGTLTMVILFSTNIWVIKYSKTFNPQLVLFCLVPVIVIYLCFSIHIQKIIGVLWCYPAIIACYYFLAQNKARIANLILILFTFPIIWKTFEIHLIIRIYLTILLVSILAGIFMKLINEQQSALRKLAVTDFLTGVLNRTSLNQLLDEAIEQHKRSNIPMTITILDIDYFKKINDEHGHVQGDEVLKDIASLLIQRCRKVDKIFRLGGEEFLILLYNTKLLEAKEIANQLRVSISNLKTRTNQSVTASFGIATIQQDENSLALIKRADDKLYQAKENGRNCIEY